MVRKDNFRELFLATALLGLTNYPQIAAQAQTFTRIDTSVISRAGGYSQGGSWGDYDNDGDLDLFVANGSRESAVNTNFLFRNEGGWLFAQIAVGDIVNDVGSSGGSSWGDYDNDGDLDLFCPLVGGQNNRLYRNEGGGTFTKLTTDVIVNDVGDSVGATWVDIDNDGDLDVHIVNDINQQDFLYRNNGDGTFSKITQGAIVTDVAPNGLSASWADFDNDGDMDVFVANNGNDRLYVNIGNGTFESVTSGDVVNDGLFSVASSWGDYDNDGNLDLFVTTTSNVILYHNNGDSTFQKITSGGLAAIAQLSGGAGWGDFDNDGDLDLLVSSWSGNNSLYRNDGGGIFSKITSGELVNETGGSCSIGDFDRDGDLDIFIARGPLGAPFEDLLYANDGNSNSWINIKCSGTVSNKSAIGARIKAKATINGMPVWQVREISQQNTYGGHHALNVHFGFGNATTVDSLVIRWPSGATDTYTNVAVNKLATATEGIGLIQMNPLASVRIRLSSSLVNFGNIVALTSDTAVVRIDNKSLTNLRIDSITNKRNEYSLRNLPSFPANIAPYGSIEFKVSFRPITDGIISDTISVASDDSLFPVVRVLVRGRGWDAIAPAKSGIMYATSFGQPEGQLYTLNIATGEASLVDSLGLSEIQGLAIHPSDNAIYGTLSTSTNTSLFRIRGDSGNCIRAGTIPVGNICAIAFSHKDSLFGITTAGQLYRIDLSQMSATPIGVSSERTYSGLAFNPYTRKLWATVSLPTNNDSLFSINRTTGEVTFELRTGFPTITPSIAFDSTGVMYCLIGGQGTYLGRVENTGGQVIGRTWVNNVRAIAMNTGLLTGVTHYLSEIAPKQYQLHQNYPNPFNPSTEIQFSLLQPSNVTLKIFNVLGEDVATLVYGDLPAGSYRTRWDATGLASGAYIYRLQAGEFVETKKLLLLR